MRNQTYQWYGLLCQGNVARHGELKLKKNANMGIWS